MFFHIFIVTLQTSVTKIIDFNVPKFALQSVKFCACQIHDELVENRRHHMEVL